MMKRAFFTTGLLLSFVLASCGTSPTASTPEASTEPTESAQSELSLDATNGETAKDETVEASLPIIGTFTFDELRELDGGGCGMSLWTAGTSPRNDGIIFFHGLGDESPFFMLDGSLVPLSRTASSGEEFYGQSTMQTFVTPEGETTLQVDVSLGELGEIESVEISEGVLTVETAAGSTEVLVEGDAGC